MKNTHRGVAIAAVVALLAIIIVSGILITKNIGSIQTGGVQNQASVINPITISSIPNQSIAINAVMGPVSFTVGGGKGTPDQITLTGRSSNSGLVSNGLIRFSGSGASRTVTATPSQDQYGTITITVEANDGVTTATTNFQLTVSSTKTAVPLPVVTPPATPAPTTPAPTPAPITPATTPTANTSPITISAIPNQSVAVNATAGPISFTVSGGKGSGSITLSGQSSNSGLVSNGLIKFSGSGANRTVTLSPSQDQYGTITVTVKATDGTNNASTNFQLTVGGTKTVPPPPTTYTVSTNFNPPTSGTVSGAGTFSSGSSVTVSAYPASGYLFTGWTEGSTVVSTQSSYTFTVSASRNLTANFSLISSPVYSLAVSKLGNGSGSVTSLPSGINCGANCSTSYTSGTSITLTASPVSGATFSGWSGACTGSTLTCTVPMTTNRSVTATFVTNTTGEFQQYIEAESGSVVSPTAVISDQYASGGKAVKTVTTSQGSSSYKFNVSSAGTYYVWARVLAPNGASDSFNVSMDSGSSDVYDDAEGVWSTLWQWTKVNGRGTTGLPASIPQRAFTLSTGQHTITFAGRESNAAIDMIAVSNNKDFVPSTVIAPPSQTYMLNVLLAGTGSGNVVSSPAGISCGAVCTQNYDPGDSLTLTATPDANNIFNGWSGACTGTGSCALTMSADKTVTASFTSNVVIPPSSGNNWYVSPSGSASGDGSMSRPWDLATALSDNTLSSSKNKTVRPGDTIWLRGGTYKGIFTSNLKGTSDAQHITVRQYPGERATVDNGAINKNVFVAQGNYTWYWGFEITDSYPNRNSSQPESWPTDRPSGAGLSTGNSGIGNKFINLIMDNNSVGVFFAKDASNIEIYGSLVYYTGWMGTDRPHGHGLYGQNAAPSTKWVKDNMFFYNADHGMQFYGTTAAPVDNLWLEGNVFFNNSNLFPGIKSGRNLLVGGGAVTNNPVIKNNYLYRSPAAFNERTSDFYLGYGTGSNNAIVTGNYIVGSNQWSGLSDHGLTLQGNTIYGPSAVINQASYPNNVWTMTKPATNAIFVRPNQYEPGRGNIVIYNWQNLNLVNVDVSSILKPGDNYELHNAEDYFNDVISATYSGGTISIPMTGHAAAKPIGLNAPASTYPEFGAFVIIKTSGGGPVTSYPLAVSTSGTGSGTIASAPSGINCGTACIQNFNPGTSVTLTATPASGSTLSGWSGACSGAASGCTVSMTSAQSVTAAFTSNSTTTTTGSIIVVAPNGGETIKTGDTYAIKWNSSGLGTSTISLMLRNDSISCPATIVGCQDRFSIGNDLTNTGSYSWDTTKKMGGGSTGPNSVSVTPGTKYKIEACSQSTAICDTSNNYFSITTPATSTTAYTLTVTKSGTGSGIITSSDSNINCGTVCTNDYDSGIAVTMTAVPSSNSVFSGWSGACSGTTNCTVTMSAAKSVAAAFSLSTTSPNGETATPATPSGLVVSQNINSGNTLNLSWTRNTTDEQGFIIERKIGGGSYIQVAITGNGITNYTDNGLTPGTTYTYRVKGSNLGGGDSNYSNSASGSPYAHADDFNLTTVGRLWEDTQTVPVEHYDVARAAGRYFAWPANCGFWNWGNVMAACFDEGPFAWNPSSHSTDLNATYNRIARSTDGGKTWSRVNFDTILTPGTQSDLDSIDYTSSSFGMLVGTSRFMGGKVGNSLWDNWICGHNVFYITNDKGLSWKGPFDFIGPVGGKTVLINPQYACDSNPSAEKYTAGRTSYIINGPKDMYAFLAGEINGVSSEGHAFMAKTTNGGKTWTFVNWVSGVPNDGTGGSYHQPSAVRVSPNELIVGVRVFADSENGPANTGEILLYHSIDNGSTWTFLSRPTEHLGEAKGNPPSLVRLKDGRLAVIYGKRGSPDSGGPHEIAARISEDNGLTWGREIILRKDAYSFDIGYVKSIVRDDGKVVSIYYEMNKSSLTDKYTNPPTEAFIGATIWDPGIGPNNAPTNLRTKPVDTGILLRWTGNSSGVSGYKIQKVADYGIPTITLTQYKGSATTPTIVPAGNANSFKVGARVNNDGGGTFTYVPSELVGLPRLFTPGAFGEEYYGVANQYTLNASGPVTVYALVQWQSYGNRLPWMDSSWTDTGLLADSSDTHGWSIWKKEYPNGGVIKLGTSDVNRYYYGMTFVFSGKITSQLGTVGSGVYNYTDSNVTPGVKYYYKVKAYSSAGDSDPSNEVNITF